MLKINKNTEIASFMHENELIGMDLVTAKAMIRKTWPDCKEEFSFGCNGYRYAEYNNSNYKIILFLDEFDNVMDVFQLSVQDDK